MTPRPTSKLLVSALIRRIEAEGGHATVLARGEPDAGAMLLVLADRGRTEQIVERTFGPDGYRLAPTGPASFEEPGALSDYVARRRRVDPDLWVVEIDHERAEEIASRLLD